MRHLRADYDRFQDPDNKIPDEEPVFLLRGQDPVAAHAVMTYAALAEFVGSDPEMVAQIRAWANQMKAYANSKNHGAPDVPDGQLRIVT